MRDSYSAFTERGAEIVAVGPDTAVLFQNYWAKENIPFVGLPDPEQKVSKLYRQEINLFKLGRMPLNCIVDIDGRIRFVHYGASMRDIPDNKELLNVIDHLNKSSE
jgi:peroxiredoxin Q/BCP